MSHPLGTGMTEDTLYFEEEGPFEEPVRGDGTPNDSVRLVREVLRSPGSGREEGEVEEG